MSFSFQISGAPPARADITAKLEQAVIDRAVFRKRNIRFMIGMATITSVYLTFIFLFVFPMLQKPEVGIIFYFFPHVTFVIFIVGNHLHIKNIEKPSKLLDTIITELSEVTADDVSYIIDSKENPAEVASYFERVTAQGRSLVHAEMIAIQKWYEQKVAN